MACFLRRCSPKRIKTHAFRLQPGNRQKPDNLLLPATAGVLCLCAGAGVRYFIKQLSNQLGGCGQIIKSTFISLSLLSGYRLPWQEEFVKECVICKYSRKAPSIDYRCVWGKVPGYPAYWNVQSDLTCSTYLSCPAISYHPEHLLGYRLHDSCFFNFWQSLQTEIQQHYLLK